VSYSAGASVPPFSVLAPYAPTSATMLVMFAALTSVKMRFHELKDTPKGQAYILWAVSPDLQFVKLGQIVNIKDRNEAEINAQTTLPDFGLLITMEDVGAVKSLVVKPTGLRLGVIEIIK